MADPDVFAPTRAAIHGVTKMREAAMGLLGAGRGCDARYPEEPVDPALQARDRPTARQRRTWQKIWGIDRAAAARGWS